MKGKVSISAYQLLTKANIVSLRGVPPWRELTHFHSLHSTGEFADGSKFEDLSKVC